MQSSASHKTKTLSAHSLYLTQTKCFKPLKILRQCLKINIFPSVQCRQRAPRITFTLGGKAHLFIILLNDPTQECHLNGDILQLDPRQIQSGGKN